MKNQFNRSATSVDELRGRAEKRLQTHAEPGPFRTETDSLRLVHELQVHQIELEIQHEELSLAQARAEASAEKFAELFDSAPIGFVSLDHAGRIMDLNFTAAKLLGRDRAALSGTAFVGRVSKPDRDTFLRHLRNACETNQKALAQVDLLCEDGRIVPVELCTICRREESGPLPLYRMAITDISDRKRADAEIIRLNRELEERVRQRTATIRTLATQLTLAEHREKSRLARVLHDHVQQLLLAARFFMCKLGRKSAADRTAVQQVQKLLAEAVDALRTLAVELSPPVLHTEGLGAAVKWLANSMEKKHGLIVEVKAASRPFRLSEEISILLYQAVQELLLNVVKHAHVSSASVTLEQTNGQLEIVISDDGKGFDPAHGAEASASDSFGLSAVHERMAFLDGEVHVQSAPGRGSRVTLLAPCAGPAVLPKLGKSRHHETVAA